MEPIELSEHGYSKITNLVNVLNVTKLSNFEDWINMPVVRK